MRLRNEFSPFNMGDTSIRVKKQVDMYQFLLERLSRFHYADLDWKDKDFQEEYYKYIHQEIIRLEQEDSVLLFENFNREYKVPEKDEIGQRARTLTNPLVKNGLLNSNRRLSEVGECYLNNSLIDADELEGLMTYDLNNLLYLRQYLKMRIYSPHTDRYFYNFRVAIKLSVFFEDIPKRDFLQIIESISPSMSEKDIEEVILDYETVANGEKSFDEYYFKHFSYPFIKDEKVLLARRMFVENDFSDEMFELCFPNGKSGKESPYKEFVLSLIELVDNKTISSYENIKELSTRSDIKKAFSFNQLAFKFTKNENIDEFLERNKDSELLQKDHYAIFRQFTNSKRTDLIREYSDMCVRSFQATGIFSFDNGLVNLNYRWLFKSLLGVLGDRFKFCGEESYSNYEEDEESIWFKNISLIDIFQLNTIDVDNVLKSIQLEFGIGHLDELHSFIEIKKELEYKEFVDKKFPKKTVINILNEISNRNDKKVFELVTKNATIPTIFEYILTIAWYHLSKNKDYLLHKSFQLTLDGNKLPLAHRGGGAGDIEIISKDYALLIEATLMNSNTQKRGELEPVIRHSINFKLQNLGKQNIQSLFIANELDSNVINIFRAMQFVNLNGTIEKGEVNGLDIFALTTKDLISILEKDFSDEYLLSTIRNNRMSKPMIVEHDWYDKVRNEIFH
ncbi:AlwI family type II restriction endonuclease [Mannheimia haemolytica]|nr:AlwI family type II restriction endonuclease [Mannheimia haemolytica]STY62658.1 AlwI restriction endonuclease [Mannheimia haemolytica]